MALTQGGALRPSGIWKAPILNTNRSPVDFEPVSAPSCSHPGVACPSHMCFYHSRCVSSAYTASLGIRGSVTTSPSFSQTLSAPLLKLGREIVKEAWDMALRSSFTQFNHKSQLRLCLPSCHNPLTNPNLLFVWFLLSLLLLLLLKFTRCFLIYYFI